MPRPMTRTGRSAAGLFLLALATALVSAQTLAAPPAPAAGKAAPAAPAKAGASTLPASTETALAASVPASALLASLAPTLLACPAPAPSLVKLAECCQKGANTYVGKYDFCYCAPLKMASVCRLGPGASQYPLLKEGSRCQTLSTHPYWPAQNISCVN